MRRPSFRAALAIPVLVLVLASGVACLAEDPPRQFHFFARSHQNKLGTPPPGKPRLIPHTDERAGYPWVLAGHLEPSTTPGGIGYYVGGGVPIGHVLGHREGRRRDEGTWGWDETGSSHFRRRMILGWSHGRKYQGGTGAYRTDGPVVPDLIYATTSTLNNLGRREDAEDHD
jgi:hypothetical protein